LANDLREQCNANLSADHQFQRAFECKLPARVSVSGIPIWTAMRGSSWR
jgi:hypothetical protein